VLIAATRFVWPHPVKPSRVCRVGCQKYFERFDYIFRCRQAGSLSPASSSQNCLGRRLQILIAPTRRWARAAGGALMWVKAVCTRVHGYSICGATFRRAVPRASPVALFWPRESCAPDMSWMPIFSARNAVSLRQLPVCLAAGIDACCGTPAHVLAHGRAPPVRLIWARRLFDGDCDAISRLLGRSRWGVSIVASSVGKAVFLKLACSVPRQPMLPNPSSALCGFFFFEIIVLRSAAAGCSETAAESSPAFRCRFPSSAERLLRRRSPSRELLCRGLRSGFLCGLCLGCPSEQSGGRLRGSNEVVLSHPYRLLSLA